MSSTMSLRPSAAFTTHIPIRSMLTKPTKPRKKKKPRKPRERKSNYSNLLPSSSSSINHHEYHDFNDTQTALSSTFNRNNFCISICCNYGPSTSSRSGPPSPPHLTSTSLIWFGFFQAFSVSDRVIPLSLRSPSVTLPASLPSRLRLRSYQTTHRREIPRSRSSAGRTEKAHADGRQSSFSFLFSFY